MNTHGIKRSTLTDTRNSGMIDRYGFGLFGIPRYREIHGNGWAIGLHRPGHGCGYASGSLIEVPKFVLYHGRRAWMSTGLMELESHAPHVAAARGRVAVAGFGMGMYVFAVAQKPEVTEVVVIEKDDSLIALLQAQDLFSAWPHWDKVSIVIADALDPDLAQVAPKAVGADYFYADIWPTCPDAHAAAQTARMAAVLMPKRAGWWGQELSFGLWCGRTGRLADADALAAYFDQSNVPHAPLTEGYVRFCQDVIGQNPLVLRPARPGPFAWLKGFCGLGRKPSPPSA